MARSGSHAQTLLDKARTDLAVVESTIGNPKVESWAIGFHPQQAVEKCLKAVLSSRKVEYPRTHDLMELVALLRDHHVELPPQSAQLHVFNRFAVDDRYEVDSEDMPELGSKSVTPESALNWAGDVLAWAERMVAEQP
jgi:HEPN domain-containing protein